MNTPPCTQAAAAQIRPRYFLDPWPTMIEVLPPVPRPPDPEPPPPLEPPLPFEPRLTLRFTSGEVYWWSLMSLCMSSGNDAYIRRAFAARSDYRNFGFRDSGATPPTVRRAWAQLGDRFTVVLGGTEAYSQFFSYTLTHYLGTQLLLNAGWCNATFAQFAVATSTECKAAWESNGSYPLLLVGHSLGGAIAPILLWQLRQRVAIAYDRIVMLGAPRAFTQSMAEKAATAQYLPFVTEADPVQYLPPPRSIVQAFGALFFAGGYPGGDYFSLPPRMQINGASGLDELPNPGISEVEWTARFANFLATNADLSPHFARTYVNQAKAYHTGGRGNVASPLDWANFDALYTLDEDLARIGL